MMNRAFKYILIMSILSGINFFHTVLAEVNSTAALISRPQVEYKSRQLRDPFQSYLTKDKATLSQPQEASNLAQPKINLDALEVQGIIWGGKMPQAIINNKVLVVGDLVDGFPISSIDKGGVSLNVAGEIIDLSAPGHRDTSKKDNEYVNAPGAAMSTGMQYRQ